MWNLSYCDPNPIPYRGEGFDDWLALIPLDIDASIIKLRNAVKKETGVDCRGARVDQWIDTITFTFFSGEYYKLEWRVKKKHEPFSPVGEKNTPNLRVISNDGDERVYFRNMTSTLELSESF